MGQAGQFQDSRSHRLHLAGGVGVTMGEGEVEAVGGQVVRKGVGSRRASGKKGGGQ